LKALCEPEHVGGEAATVSCGKTNLILLDSHANQKGFTVCTLPDTAPDTFDFIKERVLPQIKARKT
jgi:hypothetical protein